MTTRVGRPGVATGIALSPISDNAVPHPDRQAKALAKLAEIAPNAAERELVLEERVAFFDCGGNFERVLCPACRAELTEWWSDRMSEDYTDGGFVLDSYCTPCCGTSLSLNDLVYDWPQGFARFALRIRGAGFGQLGGEHLRELAAILGTPLRLIYGHL